MKTEERSKGRGPLTCRQAENMMQDYLDDKLDDKEFAAFLAHIRSCTHCYDELETNFMVHRTIQVLNQEEDLPDSYNMRPLLEKDLEQRRTDMIRERRITVIRRTIIVVTLVLLVLLILDITNIFAITAEFAKMIEASL